MERGRGVRRERGGKIGDEQEMRKGRAGDSCKEGMKDEAERQEATRGDKIPEHQDGVLRER